MISILLVTLSYIAIWIVPALLLIYFAKKIIKDGKKLKSCAFGLAIISIFISFASLVIIMSFLNPAASTNPGLPEYFFGTIVIVLFNCFLNSKAG